MLDYFKPTESLPADDGNLVFDATGGGGRSTVLLPYIEQHGETSDGGFIIDWTTGDGRRVGIRSACSNHRPVEQGSAFGVQL
jgi:hypothetical protein